uniref:CUB domain-containing protein n=1 Tax=Macrostomum lignano TaxID=282301 RepID=A0A1I8J500_9PLAT
PGAIPFETPDITVCGVTPISYSNYYETVAKHPSVYANLYSSAAQLAYISTMVGLGGQYETLMPIAKDMFDPSFLLRYLGTRQEYFIVKCTYKGYNCSFTDFENYWVSEYGNCFRFSPSATLLNQTKEIAEFSLELVLFTDNYPVLGNPESLTIYGRLTAGVTYEGIYDVSKSGGAILFYGEKDHFPRDYINLSPGVHSYVDFEMVEYQ